MYLISDKWVNSPYEIFEPDRDGIQPDSGGNTILGAKHQPDMNLTKKLSRSVLESRASVSLVSCRSLAGWDTNTSVTRAENIMHGLAA